MSTLTDETTRTEDFPAQSPEAASSGFDADIFTERESQVRSYCRSWPAVFDHAEGAWLPTRTASATSTSSPAPAR